MLPHLQAWLKIHMKHGIYYVWNCLDTIMASGEPFVKLRVTINGFFIEHFETSSHPSAPQREDDILPTNISWYTWEKPEGQESSRFCCPSAVSYFELRSSEVKNEDQRIAILFIIFIQYFLKNIHSAHFSLSMQWNKMLQVDTVYLVYLKTPPQKKKKKHHDVPWFSALPNEFHATCRQLGSLKLCDS